MAAISVAISSSNPVKEFRPYVNYDEALIPCPQQFHLVPKNKVEEVCSLCALRRDAFDGSIQKTLVQVSLELHPRA